MNLNELVSNFEAARKTFQEQSQTSLKKAFVQVFEQYPEITAFVWCQYTPYFNDGDECVFRVNEVCFTNIPLDEIDDVSEYGEYVGARENVSAVYSEGEKQCDFFIASISYLDPVSYPLRGQDLTDLEGLLNALESSALRDVMKATFGNHVKVVATRNGFDVEEYIHD